MPYRAGTGLASVGCALCVCVRACETTMSTLVAAFSDVCCTKGVANRWRFRGRCIVLGMASVQWCMTLAFYPDIHAVPIPCKPQGQQTFFCFTMGNARGTGIDVLARKRGIFFWGHPCSSTGWDAPGVWIMRLFFLNSCSFDRAVYENARPSPDRRSRLVFVRARSKTGVASGDPPLAGDRDPCFGFLGCGGGKKTSTMKSRFARNSAILLGFFFAIRPSSQA